MEITLRLLTYTGNPVLLIELDWPKKITLRLITYTSDPVLLIEFDEQQVASFDWDREVDDPHVAMEALEAQLGAFGYAGDHWRSYSEMSLTVLNLYRGLKTVKYCTGCGKTGQEHEGQDPCKGSSFLKSVIFEEEDEVAAGDGR